MDEKPNVVFVFADQWRAQATGYAGDPNVRTPHLDALSKEGVNFTTAVSNCPVCSPYRASLVTGQYALSHGVFVNDVHLGNRAVSIAQAFGGQGYDTAYVGKWHLNGRGRLSFIPREDRQGFDFWRVMECTHKYNESEYYADENEKLKWDGYDAEAQTGCACEYIRSHDAGRPFALFVSWGPPHNPYETAPERFRSLYDPDRIVLRPNVPEEAAERARRDLAGYYAHCSALDACVGLLLDTLDDCAIAENTLFVFTSDHGDMLGSQDHQRKQKPWDESILSPFLLRWPARLGEEPREVRRPFGCVDIMPTLLGLCGVPIPETVEGLDWSGFLEGERGAPADAALIACYHRFGEWVSGREYRGVRTERHTYARDRNGPWLLYDNERDPYQLENLCRREDHKGLQAELEATLSRMLEEQQDEFLAGLDYMSKWGYPMDETGTVPYGP